MEKEVFEKNPESRNYHKHCDGSDRWLRSESGYLAGVCEGISRTLGVPPWIVRVAWLVAILFFGTGVFFYLALAVCLPEEGRLHEAYQTKVLGVCLGLSRRLEIEVGVIRLLVVLLGVLSLGLVVVGYFMFYFVTKVYRGKQY